MFYGSSGTKNFMDIIPMGYEVDEEILELYAQHLLSKPIDPSEERFGTFTEKDLKLHKEFKKPKIQKKVRREVEAYVESIGISKEVV